MCAAGAGRADREGLGHPAAVSAHHQRAPSACNQTSNREPVVSYDETTVLAGLHELKDEKLVRFVLPSHGRSVVRYRQVLDETLGLDAPQCATLAVLLLRGSQTIGELRIRTERMATFDSLEEIQHQLEFLGSARRAPRAQRWTCVPGKKEERWATPLVAPDTSVDSNAPQHSGAGATDARVRPSTSSTTCRSELTELRAEVADLRHEGAGTARESLRG